MTVYLFGSNGTGRTVERGEEIAPERLETLVKRQLLWIRLEFTRGFCVLIVNACEPGECTDNV